MFSLVARHEHPSHPSDLIFEVSDVLTRSSWIFFLHTSLLLSEFSSLILDNPSLTAITSLGIYRQIKCQLWQSLLELYSLTWWLWFEFILLQVEQSIETESLPWIDSHIFGFNLNAEMSTLNTTWIAEKERQTVLGSCLREIIGWRIERLKYILQCTPPVLLNER